uniref:Uncharacterized protein n=1 Tax=Sinocyclocheilus rhinocerous TaxID=307959 RepID=A0A673HDR9_9TELE
MGTFIYDPINKLSIFSIINLIHLSLFFEGKLNWTTFGCETKINNNTIKCSCSHLTFFAVLMVKRRTYTIIIHFRLQEQLFLCFNRKAKSNQATKILMNMFVALCLLNASFLSNESVANTQDNAACVFIALLLHYSMLASFTWFFIQALHMYLWLIRQNVTITNYMRKITVLGWGELDLNTTCWTTNPYIHYIVNIGYYALVFVFTTGVFIMIVTKVVQARNIKAVDGKRKMFRKQLMMVLSLFLLFGLTWSVAFFSYGPMLIPSYYIFTVLNSLQGEKQSHASIHLAYSISLATPRPDYCHTCSQSRNLLNRNCLTK